MPFANAPIPTREEGLKRLEAFLPYAGAHYREHRNDVRHPTGLPTVSSLSPWLRHRLITEEEVIAAAIAHHGSNDAEKFIQEVFWRVYWKGYLEQRPTLWKEYRQTPPTQSDAPSGIECLDAWEAELKNTGYLHNHVRMWFASIWQFTLGRSWQSGADLFLRYLIDGDPASNTLSWRWVGGYHTNNKIYLASTRNIEKHTLGQHSPTGLARGVTPPPPAPVPARIPLPAPEAWEVTTRTGLLITEDDLCPESLFGQQPWAYTAGLCATEWRSALPVGEAPKQFAREAVADALRRNRPEANAPSAQFDANDAAFNRLAEKLSQAGVKRLLTAYVPCGPTADAVHALRLVLQAHGINIIAVPRAWDLRWWPLATHGFFRFWKGVDLTDL